MNGITVILIGIGAVIMILAIIGTRTVLRRLPGSRYQRYWHVLQFLAGFFFVGYLAAIVMVMAGLRDWILLVTGIVFLFGALFVYLVVRLGYLTISELVKTKEAAEEANHQLQTLQQELTARIETRTVQLQASADVGRAVASILDVDQLLREMVNLITERFDFYYAAVFLADETGKWAVLREASGEAGRVLKEHEHRLEVGGQSMVGTVMETLRPRIALDVADEAVRFANPLLPETRSEIALPLVVGSRALGALDVQSLQEAAFDETSAAVLQVMADQIAVALSNSMQFQQSQAALESARRMNEASFAIAQAGGSSELLNAVVTYTASDADWAAIVQYGPEDVFGQVTHVEVSASWSRRNEDVPLLTNTRYDLSQLPLVEAVKPGEPVIITDIAGPSVEPVYQQALSSWNVRAALGVTLVAGNEPIGMLLFAFRHPHQFATSLVESVQTVAQQAAVVLRNWQLAAESQATLQQLDETNQRLTGEAWEKYAAASGQPVRKEQLGYGIAREAVQASLPSAITAPVVVNGVEVGALRLEDAAADRAWTPTEVSVLQAIASEVSIAIERARLTEETERRARRERTINRITSRIRNAPSIEQMLAIAAQELRSEMHAARSVVEIASGSETTPVASAPRGNGSHEA